MNASRCLLVSLSLVAAAAQALQLGPEDDLFVRGVQRLAEGELDQAATLFEEIVRDHGNTSTDSNAMLYLARIHRQKENKDRELHWLKRCAAFQLTEPTRRGLMDTDNTRSLAYQQLGHYYEREKNWQEALKWWQAWKPQSSCGTCLISMRASRERHIALCLVRLGDHAAATGKLLDALVNKGLDSEQATLLFQLYDQAGQADTLLRLVDSLEKERFVELRQYVFNKDATDEDLRSYLGTGPIRDMKKIRDLTAQRNVAELIALAQGSNRTFTFTWLESERLHDWRALAAAESLAQIGPPAVKPIRQAIREAKANVSWLIYALSKIPGQESVAVLDEMIPKATRDDTENIIAALLRHGESGQQVLRRHDWVARADQWQRENLYVEEEPLPPPVKGSLPKTLPTRRPTPP